MFRRCQHLRTRCIHGDEGWARMKVYLFRFWKEAKIRRQACLDCGAALDRGPICAAYPFQHTIDGPWDEDRAASIARSDVAPHTGGQPVDWDSPTWGGGVHHATTDDLGDHGRHADETEQ